jgi:parvulin-like peptidyl-prolyl isomerase
MSSLSVFRALCVVCVAALCTRCTPRRDDRPSQDPVPISESSGAEATPAVIAVRVVFVSQGERSQAAALERARSISLTAKNGERMTELVRSYSEHPSALTDLGALQLRVADPAPWGASVVSAALALRVGAVSEPLAVDGGYLVLERLPNPDLGPARIAAKHILISYVSAPKALEATVHTEAEARAIADDVARQAAVPDADWNVLAAKYTEEPGGKERGGDLGQFGRGQMVPAFESAAFALEVGQVSGVVQSPFGFHVIKRYE